MSQSLRQFEQEVLRRSQEVPVLVDFWAPWCGPCKMLGPVLERLAASANGTWDLVKINTEEQPQLAQVHDISSIPAVKLFRNGKVVDQFVGFRNEADIRKWLQPHLDAAPAPGTGTGADEVPPPDSLEVAAEHIDNGDLPAARALIEAALAESPDRAPAKLLLAEILLEEDPVRAVELARSIPADAPEHLHAQALLAMATAVQWTADSIPDDKFRPQLLAGLAAIRRRDWDAALESLVEVVELRPRLANGLATEAGKAIFRYLGIRHPVVEKHYRRFSGAVNS